MTATSQLLLVVFLWCSVNATITNATNGIDEYLVYEASYHGILSLGLDLSIAGITMSLPALSRSIGVASAVITLNTENYTKVELFMPIRFCYRNNFKLNTFATTQANWWNRIGNKTTKAQLRYDDKKRRVQFRQVERRLAGWSASELLVKREIKKQPWAGAPDPDVFELKFPNTGEPMMDRLTMLYWLRKQVLLEPGMSFHLLVSDGRKLVGFGVQVEAAEQVAWNDLLVPSVRVRLQPKFNTKADDSPIWVWLSRDDQRLPLLFRSKRALGTFEVKLVRIVASALPACSVPEAATLELPAFK